MKSLNLPDCVRFVCSICMAFILLLSCNKDEDTLESAVFKKETSPVFKSDTNGATTPEETDEDIDADTVIDTTSVTDTVTESLPQKFDIETRTTAFPPIHDAHFKEGKGHNSVLVHLGNNLQNAYLMFDLSPIDSIAGNIVSAHLEFNILEKSGSGQIAVFQGISNDWIETDLSKNSLPESGIPLGAVQQNHSIGENISIDLQASALESRIFTFILKLNSGGPLAFASKENGNTKGSRLVVTYESPVSADAIVVTQPESSVIEMENQDEEDESSDEEDAKNEDASENSEEDEKTIKDEEENEDITDAEETAEENEEKTEDEMENEVKEEAVAEETSEEEDVATEDEDEKENEVDGDADIAEETSEEEDIATEGEDENNDENDVAEETPEEEDIATEGEDENNDENDVAEETPEEEVVATEDEDEYNDENDVAEETPEEEDIATEDEDEYNDENDVAEETPEEEDIATEDEDEHDQIADNQDAEAEENTEAEEGNENGENEVASQPESEAETNSEEDAGEEDVEGEAEEKTSTDNEETDDSISEDNDEDIPKDSTTDTDNPSDDDINDVDSAGENTTEDNTTEDDTTDGETTEVDPSENDTSDNTTSEEDETEEETSDNDASEENTSENDNKDDDTPEEMTPPPPPSNTPPNTVIEADLISGRAPLTINFSGANSNDDKAITAYEWDFQDGTTADGANTAHSFIEGGIYEVSLKTTDEEGLSTTKSITITVEEPLNEAPKAIATANTLSGTAPLPVNFIGSTSSDDQGITSYRWDFPGSSSSNPDASHTFAEAGEYKVTLTVTDAQGLSATAPLTITVDRAEEPVSRIDCNDGGGRANAYGQKAWCWNTITIPDYSGGKGVGFGNGLFIDSECYEKQVTKSGDKIKFKVDPTGPQVGSWCSRQFNLRAEIRTEPWNVRHAKGTEEWFGWSYTFGNDYKVDMNNQWKFFQVHNGVVGKPPQIGLEVIHGNQFRGHDAGEIYVTNASGGEKYTPTGIVPKAGQTIEVVVHAIWSDASNGLLQVSIDGKMVYDKQVATVLPGNPWAGNAKWGIYIWPWSDESRVQKSKNQGIAHLETLMGPLRIITRKPGDPDYGEDAYDLVRPK